MPKYRIVIADDHKIFREGLKCLIEKDQAFSIVGQASDGEELLELVKKVSCDLVVTDLNMPHLDGIELIKEIRKRTSRIKILVLTMQKDHEHFKHAINAGASGYLLKDDAFESFSLAVKCIMKNKKFVSPSVATLLTDRYIRSIEEADTPSLHILTKREKEILELVANGQTNKIIATQLKLSVRTVETHRNNLSNKLGIKSTANLVKFAYAKGMI